MGSLKEGEWSFYGGGQFNAGRNVTEVVSLIEGKWSCYRRVHFNGWNGHVT